jgi:hypothetical protein
MSVPLQHFERGQSGVRQVSLERLQSQTHSILRYASDKGLTVNVSNCVVLVTGMHGLGGTVQYGNDTMPNVRELCYLGMWLFKTMSMSFTSRRICGSTLAAWRQVLPVTIKHGVRDIYLSYNAKRPSRGSP